MSGSFSVSAPELARTAAKYSGASQPSRLAPSRLSASRVAAEDADAYTSIVTSNCACGRICITIRGCPSRSTSSVAQVRRALCTVICRTPAASQRAAKYRG